MTLQTHDCGTSSSCRLSSGRTAGLWHLLGEVEVVFTGMRPGEKMFEELVIGAELRPTAHAAVMVAVSDGERISELFTIANPDKLGTGVTAKGGGASW